VLTIKPTAENEQLATLPMPPANVTHSDVVVTMKMSEDGSVQGTATIKDQGASELLGRAILANLPEGQDAMISSRVLAITGQNGSGSFDKGDPRDLSKPYVYKTAFNLPNVTHMPGPGAFVVPTGFHSMSAISGISLVTSIPDRKYPLAGCADASNHEDYTLELPKTIKVTTLPKNALIKSIIGEYSSRYELKGHTLHVLRDLTMLPGTAACSPVQYQELRTLASGIGKDLRAQVLYQ